MQNKIEYDHITEEQLKSILDICNLQVTKTGNISYNIGMTAELCLAIQLDKFIEEIVDKLHESYHGDFIESGYRD